MPASEDRGNPRHGLFSNLWKRARSAVQNESNCTYELKAVCTGNQSQAGSLAHLCKLCCWQAVRLTSASCVVGKQSGSPLQARPLHRHLDDQRAQVPCPREHLSIQRQLDQLAQLLQAPQDTGKAEHGARSCVGNWLGSAPRVSLLAPAGIHHTGLKSWVKQCTTACVRGDAPGSAAC